MKDAVEFADRAAIQDLVWKFADAVNRNDETAFIALWSNDGRWRSEAPPSLDAQGVDEIQGLFAGLMGQWSFFHQITQPGPAEVNGDRATSSSYVQELGMQPSGDTIRTYGRYNDRFVLTGDGWRFEERFFSFHFMDAPPLEPKFLRPMNG